MKSGRLVLNVNSHVVCIDVFYESYQERLTAFLGDIVAGLFKKWEMRREGC